MLILRLSPHSTYQGVSHERESNPDRHERQTPIGATARNGKPTRETALLLAQIEEEQERHDGAAAELARRADELDHGTGGSPARLLDRPHPPGLDPRAAKPGARPDVTEVQAKRGVVFAYETANPTFYRAVNNQLRPGESPQRHRYNHGTYEYTRDEFLATLPEIARTDSYRIGTKSAPGACRYTTGNPSPAMKTLKAPD